MKTAQPREAAKPGAPAKARTVSETAVETADETQKPGIERPQETPDFGEIVSRHETPLLRYLRRMADPDEAEDIAQEAFIRLHREMGRRSVASVAAFLFRAAHNLALDQRRRRRARAALVGSLRERAVREPSRPGEDSPEGLAAMIRRAACEKALEELGRLPSTQRQVLLLKIIQGFTLREIAEIVGTSPGNVAHRLSAGLSELARRLKAAGVI